MSSPPVITTSPDKSSDLYRRTPLTNRSNIRALRFHPAPEQDTRLSGTLEVISFQHSTPYHALSYTWDAPFEDQKLDDGEIWLDGLRFAIRGNLEHVLRRLRYRNRNRVLWIDQICINQSDNGAEKAQQIGIMGEIFSNAATVIVWLGEDSLERDGAFMMRCSIVARREDNANAPKEAVSESAGELDELSGELNAFEPRILRTHQQQYDGKDLATYLAEWPNAIELADKFASRRYFSRRWVIQEIVPASDVLNESRMTVLCGDYQIPWQTLGKGLEAAWRLGSRACAGPLDFYRTVDICSMETKQMADFDMAALSPPTDTLRKFQRFKCRDLQDRVYALMGLWPRKYRFTARPGMTVKDVYTEVVRQAATAVPELFSWIVVSHLLPYAAYQAHTLAMDARIPGLSSWIPDWYLHIPNCSNPLRDPPPYHAHFSGTTLTTKVSVRGTVHAYEHLELGKLGIKVETKRGAILLERSYPALVSWNNGCTNLSDGDLLCSPEYSFRRGTTVGLEDVHENVLERLLDGVESDDEDSGGEDSDESTPVCIVLRPVCAEPLTCKIAGLCPTRLFDLSYAEILTKVEMRLV